MAFPHDGNKFEPGQSGNINGRPKLPDLKELMAEILGREKDGKVAAQKILDKMEDLARNGNIKATEFLFSRGYGLPKQSIEHSGQVSFSGVSITPPDPDSPENTNGNPQV
jgi:hypothetical protein